MKNYFKVFTPHILFCSLLIASCDNKKTSSVENGEVTTEKPRPSVSTSEHWMGQPTFTEVPVEIQESVTEITDKYLTLKESLIEGKTETIQKVAMELSELAASLPNSELAGEQKDIFSSHIQQVAKQASAISESADLDNQRNTLNELTTHVYTLAKGFNSNSPELYLQHCPMARNNEGGYWLSTTETIRNPYFGDKMLKCGETKSKL